MAASPPPDPKRLKMSSSDNDDPAAAADGGPPPELKTPRYKRRKIAIFLAYCGLGYQGMQKNPGARTIESDLEAALFHAGAVPPADRNCPKRYDWARSARTDKGVSAIGQVVSGRFYVDPDPAGFVARLNAALSPQIRAFGFKRATASFNAKKFCDRRRYVYLLPVFALDPTAHPDRETVLASLGSESGELVRCVECSERGRKVPGLMGRHQPLSPIDDLASNGVSNAEAETKTDNSLEESTVAFEKMETDLGSVTESKLAEPTVKIETPEPQLADPRVKIETETGIAESQLADPTVKIETESTVALSQLADSMVNIETEPLGVAESRLAEPTVKTETVPESQLSDPKVKIETETGVADSGLAELRVAKDEGLTESAISSKADTVTMATRNSEFRYGDKEKERFNGILKRYVGTHNFHNFTARIKAEDPSAQRYIISFNADTIVTIDNIDFIKCEVVGQSFMLHQIRKMVGFAVAIMRGCTRESLMDIALRKDVNITVPTAPEVGLFLDECFFTSYNQKWKDTHEELSMESYVEQAEDFKFNHIYPHIASMEHKEGAVSLWLHSLNCRNYPDFNYQEPNGEHVKAEKATGDIQADDQGDNQA